LPPQPRRT